jgi:PAS domain S-box-containing protein
MPENVAALSPDEVRQTIHELRVHQIELEMQNEELRRTQGELEAARARYFDLYDLAPVGYCTLNEKGLILEANLTAATLLGVARRALVKRILTRFILKEDQTIYYRIHKLLLETEAPQACELRMVKKDGTLFWAHLEAITALDADGKAISRIGLSDVPERRRVEEALKESEEKYRFLAASVDSMYLMDKDLTYLFMNEGHRTRFGLPLEKIIGRRYGDFHSAEDTRKISDCIGDVCKTGKPIINEHRSERDGAYFLRTFTPLMSQSPAGEISKVVIVSKDITQRKQAEKYLVETVQQLQETRDMLIQFEKEAAVGRLAVSIAHETLNPASIISSRLQFLEEENLSEQARENVRISREQLQRIVKINQDLHQSAAKQPGMLVGGDLRRVIEVGLQMTERRIKEDHVQVEYDPLPEIIPVKMERDRLVKVMVNLILNACDAMTGNQIKRLIITVHHPEDSPKRYSILLAVADNGQGIPTGNLNRIFEPFFTTKDPGKGTGLGLSVSKGIIQEHGGTIHSENNDMGGTSFIVELPLDRP